MQIFSSGKTYGFMKYNKLFISLSIILVFGSIGLLLTKGLNYGIDFAGGTLVQIKYDKKAPIKKIRELLSKHNEYKNASVTEFGSEEEIVIRFASSSASVEKDLGDKIHEILKPSGNFQIRRVDIVGPKVGGELREKGVTAMVVSIIAILIYIAFRFEWRFGIASVVALFHDVTISMGALSLFNIDINLDILAALLTLMGYSLNDTIIVFDRIREEIRESKLTKLFDIIDYSVSRTLSRTTLTSLTTFFVVLTLYLFGGEIISGFSFTLLVGIIIGTYSSIFVASPLLSWFRFDVKGFRAKEAEKAKREAEKEKMRAMYEGGVV